MTDLLLAKKEDLILCKRLTKLVGLPFGKWPGQVYLRDLSPDMWRGRRSLKARVGHDAVSTFAPSSYTWSFVQSAWDCLVTPFLDPPALSSRLDRLAKY